MLFFGEVGPTEGMQAGLGGMEGRPVMSREACHATHVTQPVSRNSCHATMSRNPCHATRVTQPMSRSPCHAARVT